MRRSSTNLPGANLDDAKRRPRRGEAQDGPSNPSPPAKTKEARRMAGLVASAPRDLLAHRLDRGRVILAPKNRRPCHERIRTRNRDLPDVLRLHATVDLQPHVAAAGIDA